MARPKNLQTKGDFSVMQYYDDWALVFRKKTIVEISKSRAHLYTERTKYSSWFKRIALLLSTDTNRDFYV